MRQLPDTAHGHDQHLGGPSRGGGGGGMHELIRKAMYTEHSLIITIHG